MSANKSEIEQLIMAIIESGQYAIKNGYNLGGYVRGFFHGDEFIPSDWPTFTEGWLDDEFYRRPLTLEIIAEWLEHLFNLKRGEPEPDMFSFAWRKAKVCGIDGIFHSGFDIAKFVLDNEPIPPRDKWTMTINTAKSLTPRTIKIVRDTKSKHGFSWEWVE